MGYFITAFLNRKNRQNRKKLKLFIKYGMNDWYYTVPRNNFMTICNHTGTKMHDKTK